MLAMPYLEQPLKDVDITEDEDAVFDCSASGLPQPTVEWYSNGRPLSGM